MDENGAPNELEIQLQYILPADWMVPTAGEDFHDRSTLSIDFITQTPEGTANVAGTVFTGVREVDGPDDAFYSNALTTDPVQVLWADPTGNIILGFSAVWMLTGILIMKKMIAFDF